LHVTVGQFFSRSGHIKPLKGWWLLLAGSLSPQEALPVALPLDDIG
jgi:hypothetical protein